MGKEKEIGRIFIGTSGWSYKEWARDFYRGIRPKDQFDYYATQFCTVEINATFYRLPAVSTVHGWRDKAPPGFVFAVKGSQFITHMKRLTNLHGGVNRFFRRIKPMQGRIGPVLWQLPANFKKDLPRLKNFLKRLPAAYGHAFEFRDPSWLDSETKGLLKHFGVAWVSVSSMQMPMDLSVTADFVYIRFHGLAGGARHDYTASELEPWARHSMEQALQGRNVFAYFNNDLNVRAPNNAKLLISLCRSIG